MLPGRPHEGESPGGLAEAPREMAAGRPSGRFFCLASAELRYCFASQNILGSLQFRLPYSFKIDEISFNLDSRYGLRQIRGSTLSFQRTTTPA